MMKIVSAHERLNATPTIGPVTDPQQVPNRRAGAARRGGSVEGVLIFCGIGLTLTLLAGLFQWLELPPPYF